MSCDGGKKVGSQKKPRCIFWCLCWYLTPGCLQKKSSGCAIVCITLCRCVVQNLAGGRRVWSEQQAFVCVIFLKRRFFSPSALAARRPLVSRSPHLYFFYSNDLRRVLERGRACVRVCAARFSRHLCADRHWRPTPVRREWFGLSIYMFFKPPMAKEREIE